MVDSTYRQRSHYSVFIPLRSWWRKYCPFTLMCFKWIYYGYIKYPHCFIKTAVWRLNSSFYKRRGRPSIDGDVPASTGTWRRCIGDILKSWTDLNFSHLNWDVGDTRETSATSPKKRSHVIVSVPVASPIHWLRRVPVTYDDMETRLYLERGYAWLRSINSTNSMPKELFMSAQSYQHPLWIRHFLLNIWTISIQKGFILSLLVDVFKSFHFFSVHTGNRAYAYTHRIQKYPYSFAYGNSFVFIA